MSSDDELRTCLEVISGYVSDQAQVQDTCTVQLSDASQTICFYDKFAERIAIKATNEELMAANGILRYCDSRRAIGIIDPVIDTQQQWACEIGRLKPS